MPIQDCPSTLATLVHHLADALARQGVPTEQFETHISLVLVAGDVAYKFKKPVRFDVLDFSTLAARHKYCQEELRLNRRLAPQLYLDVVAVSGSAQAPCLAGAGTPIEYAVKMRAFPQTALWRHRIDAHALTAAEVDALAAKLARFHVDSARAPQHEAWGSAAAIWAVARADLALIGELAGGALRHSRLARLQAWEARQQIGLGATLAGRKADGFIRECHGDLHSGNILTLDGAVQMFDCIEFNPALRWIDGISDLAFIDMDLRYLGRPDLAARLRNGYLEHSGDYAGLAVLGLYRTLRALVRAKVALLAAQQADMADAARRAARRYLAFALCSIGAHHGAVLIMHGYAGSGKSTVAAQLVELLDAVCIRSDVERKRLHGVPASERAAAPPDQGLYAQPASAATYARLLTLARTILAAGLPVIVDAAFLTRAQRAPFSLLADELGVAFCVLDVRASAATMQARIAQRTRSGHDPSDADAQILSHQLTHHEALSDAELRCATVLDSDAGIDLPALAAVLRRTMRAARPD